MAAATTIVRTTWTDDSGGGTDGTVLNNAELQLIYDEIDDLLDGTTANPLVFGGSIDIDKGSTTLTQHLLTVRGGGGAGAYGFLVEANGGDDIFRTNNLTYDVIMNEVAGKTFIGDSSNAKMTTGLTIQMFRQGDEILALKSTDVAHGITTETETDTFGTFTKASTTAGGVLIAGYTEADSSGVVCQGASTSSNTTKTTAGGGCVEIRTYQKSGTGLGALDADANLMAIRDTTTTRFIFDIEGSGHADVEWTTYDRYDDLAELERLQAVLTGSRVTPVRYGSNVLAFHRRKLERMGIVGRGSWHRENGRLKSMVNFTKLSMLHHGALLQLDDRDRTRDAQIKILQRDNRELTRRVQQLARRIAA